MKKLQAKLIKKNNNKKSDAQLNLQLGEICPIFILGNMQAN